MFPRRFSCLLFLLAMAATPACAAPVSIEAGYLLTLGGFNVASATVKLNDDGRHYDLDLEAEIAGLAGLVASGTAHVGASGSSAGTQLASEKFDLLTRANGEDFKIDVGYEGGNVSSFVVTPPLTDNVDRVPIERSQLFGVGDMLSAFVLKGRALDRSLCDRKFRIFTGVERFDLAMSYLQDDKATSLKTAYQGPVVQCRIKYTPVSGHFTTSGMTNYLAKSDQLYIWYAPAADTGYFIPYRVLIATSVGDLSMVLTKLSD
ncbi:MAG TPA: DUF3108 domain-containing protein [Devosia sp.]|nr:DUF3108 domain-containing protein [Devosia sp.]